jgi:hypothetical protein
MTDIDPSADIELTSANEHVMPLARWSKLAMTVQAIGSLAVLGLVVARAVNIFK